MIVGPNQFSFRRPCSRHVRFGFAFLLLVCISVVTLLGSICAAQEQHTSGSSSKSLRKQTVKSLPLNELTPQTRDKINAVVLKPSIYRRLPVTSIEADPDHFRFLVRYPEVVVNIWQLMGVTKMDTERTGPFTISSNDGAGTISSIELVYGTDNLHIFYGTGTYEGPILKRKLTGNCVLVLRSESQTGPDGKPTQTSQLDVFLKVENATAGLIAKTIQPIVGTTADHNFVESLKFIQRLDNTTQKNGPGVEQMSTRLDIDPNVRQKYAKVIDQVFQRAINASAPAGSRTLRETSLQPRQLQQPPLTLEQSKFSNPNYSNQSSNLGFQNYSDAGAYPNAGSRDRSSGTATYPSQHQQPHVPSVQLRDGGQLPARGYQAPTYGVPKVGVYPAYGYQQPQTTGQVRQQAYSQHQSQYGPNYNAAHAYRQFSEGGQAAQTHYQQYGSYPASPAPVQTVGGWHGR